MKKVLFIATIINVLLSPLYSQDFDITVMEDQAIIEFLNEEIDSKSPEVFDHIAMLDIFSPTYINIESFITDKIDELIINGGLDYPLKLVESVLYNNMENQKAQEQYTIIINKNIELEERRALEKEKKIERPVEDIDKEVIELKEELELEETMESIVTTNLENISIIEDKYNDYNKTHFVNDFYLYPLHNRIFSSQVYSGYFNTDSITNNYGGFAIDMGTGLTLGLLKLKLDSSIAFTYNSLFKDSIKQLTGSLILSTGLSFIDLPISLRTGFLSDNYFYDSKDPAPMAILNLPTPTLGVGLNKFVIYDFTSFDFSTDFLLASIYTDNFSFGINSRLYLNLNIFRFDKVNLELKGGLDFIYLNEQGLSEYSIQPKLGFGVSSYE